MNMKKALVVFTVAALAVTEVFAAVGSRKRAPVKEAGSEDEPASSAKAGDVTIQQYPKLGNACCLAAPSLAGASLMPNVYKKPRSWIVLETEYQTKAKVMEQLTFTWHVILETKNATNKDKEGMKKLAPYSYFTATTTYHNIPRGNHASSVCLHPSYLECYGTPCAVGLVVTNEKGEELGGDTVAVGQVPTKFFKGKKFWEDSKIMDATGAGGGAMIERRQGLVDRSKTIWALVNPNDYELTLQ